MFKVDKCLNKKPFINIEDNSCIDICNSEDFFNEKCTINNHTTEGEKIILNNIIEDIENGNLDKLLLGVINERKDIIIQDNERVYQITSSLNQNNNKNISSIKLGECENILKKIMI